MAGAMMAGAGVVWVGIILGVYGRHMLAVELVVIGVSITIIAAAIWQYSFRRTTRTEATEKR